QCGDQPGVAARGVAGAAPAALGRTRGQITIDRFARGLVEALATCNEPARKTLQIAAIARQCVVGQTLLGPDAFDEGVDRSVVGVVERRAGWCDHGGSTEFP